MTIDCAIEAAKDYWRPNQYALKEYVLRDGKKHPFAIICPGGGYSMVCSFVEGLPYVPNPSQVAVSDDPLGPYVPIGNPHRNDESCASFNSQVSFIFQAPQWDNFYLVMADRWVPKYVVTGERYQQILRVVARQSDKSYKPSLANYLTVAGAPFLGTANTSIAEYVWLPMGFEGEMPVIDWNDEWIIEELAGKGKGDAGV